MEPIFIYALNCPTTGKPRYIGQTSRPDIRLGEHLGCNRGWYSARWIRSLLAKNLRPEMEILDVVPDSEADFWEREYIQNFRERGFRLTNFSDGGSAPMRGKHHTLETRRKIGASNSGKIRSPGACEKIGASKRGTKLPPEHRKKISTSHLGKKFSLERCKNISESKRGKKFSPEHCLSLSLSHRGKTLSSETRAKMSVSQRERRAREIHNA